MSGLLPTSFMHWQEKSVLFEERASVPARNTFVSRQRDRTLGGTGYLGRHCQYCGHAESVTPAGYMRLRAQRIAARDPAAGGRVRVSQDAVHPEDGIPHRHRGLAGTLRKPIPGREGEWIVALDNNGPLALHVSNMDPCEPGE